MKQFIIAILLIPCLLLNAQDRRMRFVEWNVENLFDTLHDVGYEDRDFLPDGAYAWNTSRYFYKLSIIARTLSALSGTTPADLIALCEVENDTVLTHLTRRSLLASLGYEYVMTHSADRRGIDVALLYQPLSFLPLRVQSISVPRDTLRERPTRDVLLVSGMVPTGDTLHVFVCHFPSRIGGRKLSEKYRMRAAAVIREAVDSIFNSQPQAMVIIAGDFNDEPSNKSIRSVLSATCPPTDAKQLMPSALYILTSHLKGANDVQGTYKYQGRWNRIDNIIVSGTLLNNTNRLHTSEQRCAIQVLPHLIEPDGRRGEVKPRRTFLGTHYHGGASDHLPLTLDIVY